MLENFFRYLQYEKRYSNHTLKSYHTDLIQFRDYLIKEFETDNFLEIDHNHIRGWVIELVESGLHENSVNRKISSVKSFFKFLLKRGEIKQNPSVKVRVLKKPKRLPKFVKEADLNQLLDTVEFSEDHSGQREQLVIELLYGTGIRLSELTGLKPEDINYHKKEIKVLGKRNKERVIPVSDYLLSLIKNYQETKSKTFENRIYKYLIVSNSGEKAYPMLIYRIVKSFLEKVGNMDVRSPHVLRHTFATHLLNKGAELNALKELLGHSNLSATQIYTHNSLEKLKDVYKLSHPKA